MIPRSLFPLAAAAAATLLACADLPASEIVGYFRDRTYRLIDTITGDTTELAPAPGGTPEAILSVDPVARVAYRMEEGTHLVLFVTDLDIKTTRSVPIIGSEVRLQAFAAFDGQLISQFTDPGGGAIRLIDPISGVAKPIINSPQATPHRSLSVDPESATAVRITDLQAQTIQVIDINTRQTRELVLDQHVLKIDVFGGRAVGLFANRIYNEIDLETGTLTFLANAPAGIQSLLFSVDPFTNIAYSVTDIGERQLAITDLTTGTTRFVTAGDSSELWQIDAHGLGTLPPKILRPITTITRDEGGVLITIPLITGRPIGVEYSTDLSADFWIELGNVSRVGDANQFRDPDPIRRLRPTGFYRAFLRE